MRGRSEFARAWPVVLAAGVGVGLGTTGLPIYTTGLFIRPLGEAFGWSRSAVAGGMTFLTIAMVLMAPVVGVLVERFGVRLVAMLAMAGFSLGYVGLALNGGSLTAYYAAWVAVAVLGAGTSPIVWTRAVASWFDRSRGLALGVTLCGTGAVAVFAPGILAGVIAAYGWRAGFFALAAAPVVIGLPLVALLFRAREAVAGEAVAVLPGMEAGEAVRSFRFWRMIVAFFLIAIVVGGMIVNLPAMLADGGVDPARAAAAMGWLGVCLIAGRLTIGGLVDRFPARVVAPVFVLLPAVACWMLARGVAAVPAIMLIGLSAGAEVDLLAYLTSRYFGMRHYARIYGFGLSAFSAGVGIGPVAGGWVHDRTGSYALALYGFTVMVVVAAGLIGGLGRPEVAPPARRT